MGICQNQVERGNFKETQFSENQSNDLVNLKFDSVIFDEPTLPVVEDCGSDKCPDLTSDIFSSKYFVRLDRRFNHQVYLFLYFQVVVSHFVSNSHFYVNSVFYSQDLIMMKQQLKEHATALSVQFNEGDYVIMDSDRCKILWVRQNDCGLVSLDSGSPIVCSVNSLKPLSKDLCELPFQVILIVLPRPCCVDCLVIRRAQLKISELEQNWS
ncbi:uncharacterized protein LOC118760934 [Octopus sinensis]|uniref:Uncharacterized protein LOC118760934 n=1 Tax=Octopus sinensis TaxID=2607531 RepID=A0A7E6EGS9_9MOLL|nr:uncharacterized protein LOC118760934 [Octopus sinensis]